jgi:hypothetical protein
MRIISFFPIKYNLQLFFMKSLVQRRFVLIQVKSVNYLGNHRVNIIQLWSSNQCFYNLDNNKIDHRNQIYSLTKDKTIQSKVVLLLTHLTQRVLSGLIGT